MQITTALLVTTLAWLLATAAMGCWVGAAYLRPRLATGGRGQRLTLKGEPLVKAAGGFFVLAALAAVAGSLTVTGGEQGAWRVAAVFWGLAALFGLGRPWESNLYALGLGALGLAAPVAVLGEADPVNHDLATDAQMVTVVLTVLLAGAWAVSLVLRPEEHEELVTTRLRTLSTGAAIVIASCDAVTLWAQPGRFDFATHDAWLLLRSVLVAAIALLAWLRPTALRATMLASSVLAALAVAAAAGAHRAAPSTSSDAFDVQAFGYSVADWPTLLNLAWLNPRVNFFFLLLSLAALAVYFHYVVQLRRRGDHWPVGRSIAWVIGWLLVVWLTSSGVGRYAPAAFSVHMFLNLGVNMAAAMILSLGGFVTLVLRANRAHRRDEPAGLREWLVATMHSRYLGFIYNPIIALIFMTGTYYVFYLTSIYPNSLDSHWLHQFVYLHFLVTGYIFYGLIIGVDQPPHPLPHIGKLGLIIGAMPFHAFFGVIVMTKQTLYASDFFNAIGHEWIGSRGLQHDQNVGGAIAWAGGEFPLIIALIALLVQWQRQDSTEARRADRHFDEGTDDSYDAYNEMMARLAANDRGAD